MEAAAEVGEETAVAMLKAAVALAVALAFSAKAITAPVVKTAILVVMDQLPAHNRLTGVVQAAAILTVAAAMVAVARSALFGRELLVHSHPLVPAISEVEHELVYPS